MLASLRIEIPTTNCHVHKFQFLEPRSGQSLILRQNLRNSSYVNFEELNFDFKNILNIAILAQTFYLYREDFGYERYLVAYTRAMKYLRSVIE